MPLPASVSPPRVSVSTEETQCPDCETGVSASRAYECAEAIQVLIEYGWVVGCDGELLPPRWVRRTRA
jgi:hypothetical protein